MLLYLGSMVFNATFNNISVISWWSVLLVEEIGVSGENHAPLLKLFFKAYLYLTNVQFLSSSNSLATISQCQSQCLFFVKYRYKCQ